MYAKTKTKQQVCPVCTHVNLVDYGKIGLYLCTKDDDSKVVMESLLICRSFAPLFNLHFQFESDLTHLKYVNIYACLIDF